MSSTDTGGEQTSLTDYADRESDPDSATTDVAALEQRVDQLEQALETTAETMAGVIDTVEDVTERVDGTADAAQYPTHTDIRGYQ